MADFGEKFRQFAQGKIEDFLLGFFDQALEELTTSST